MRIVAGLAAMLIAAAADAQTLPQQYTLTVTPVETDYIGRLIGEQKVSDQMAAGMLSLLPKLQAQVRDQQQKASVPPPPPKAPDAPSPP